MAFILTSCAPQKKVTTKPFIMWIKGIKVDCTGVGSMKCMLVQKSDIIEPGKWQSFYNEIDGFQFQSGYLSKLLVSEEKLSYAHVPADASSIKYKMIELLEKKQDPVFVLHDIWVLESLENKPFQTQGNSDVLIAPSIEINLTEMKIMGNDGCNQFFGPVTKVEDEIIEFGNLAGTMKMCINMEIPDNFNKAMAQVKKYKRDGLKLYLLDGAGNELLQFKKVD